MSENVDQIAGLVAGLSVLLAFIGYGIVLQHRRLDARLAVFVGGRSLPIAPSAQQKTPSPRRGSSKRVALIGAGPHELVQAGVSLTPGRFLVIQVIVGLIGLGLGGLLARTISLAGLEMAVAMALGSLIGLSVPKVLLRFKRSGRLGKFEGQFASALDSLANAMEVGLSLAQALEAVSRDMPAPLGPEFGQVVRGLGMGLGLSEVLDQLADRVPLRDVEIFVTAVHIQHRTGGALTQLLRNIATTVRQRVNLRAEVRAMTAQQRFSAYLVSALPLLIAVAVKFLNPAYFSLMLVPGTMRLLLVGAGIGIVVGFYVMMRIADIEV